MLVYLATPYSKFPGGREMAYQLACAKAAQLMHQGYEVFCPIAHSHSIETEAMPHIQDGDWWLKQDFAVLKHCDKLAVYQMPGWDVSYGVAKEVDFANNYKIPVEFIPYEQNRTF